MLKFNLEIRNPFFKNGEFDSLWEKSGSFTRYKHWELQLMQYGWNLFELNFDLNWNGRDHAGPNMEVGIFGYQLAITVYDSRHWDYENNTWEVYDREERENTEKTTRT